ncbi:MAG: hypothetical protein WC522_09410, partial [Candidatus Omnitrophota bacterium]
MLAWQGRTWSDGESFSLREGSTRGESASMGLETDSPKPLIMDLRSPRNKWWMSTVAVTLIICFIHQDIVWAQEGTPVWSSKASGSFNTPKTTPPPLNNNNLNANIALPKDIAVVKEAYSASTLRHGQSSDNSLAQEEPGSQQKTVIQIQDAHASMSAQESISSILDSLVTNYDLKLVAIEGSTGYIDTSILKTFPDERIRNTTAKYLMSKGKMSAGEFYSITSNKPIALYGIENKDLYKENAGQFKKICAVNVKVAGDIDNLLKRLTDIQDKVYSPELKALESNSVL